MDNVIKSFDKGMAEFNKNLKDFGDSMQSVNDDFKDDITKSEKNAESRAKKDKENLDRIWGSKK